MEKTNAMERTDGPSDRKQADSLRQLWRTSTMIDEETVNPINPLWLQFPTKCTRTVPSEHVMRRLLDHYNTSNDVMVVKYYQERCTACNAIGKIFEFLCHDMAKKYPRLHFYEVQREKVPEATANMVKFPQVKVFSHGQWADVDYKPPQDFRDSVYAQVERHVHQERKAGKPVTAIQAEEMYFSASAPAITTIMEESLTSFYARTQTSMHDYWKQVSLRRSWFFKNYLVDKEQGSSNAVEEAVSMSAKVSVLGEKVQKTVSPTTA